MTEYVLSLSYGKDSLACLGAIEQLGWPLSRIVHAEVWATNTIPADLPPMVEFKAKADAIIKERFGIEVEHFRAKHTFEELFYRVKKTGRGPGDYRGFPMVRGPWCNSDLKRPALRMACGKDSVQYVGIAADEPERLARLDKYAKVSPLEAVGWDEATCRKWCEDHDLLSPIYTTSTRGGCWFCHNQGVSQLRHMRKAYPEYWAMLLKWDKDSPITFKPDGHTVHDFDARFAAEDAGLIDPAEGFRWEMIGRKIVKPRVELPGQMTMEEVIGNADPCCLRGIAGCYNRAAPPGA